MLFTSCSAAKFGRKPSRNMKSRACMTEKSCYLVKRCDGTDLTWKNSFHPHSQLTLLLCFLDCFRAGIFGFDIGLFDLEKLIAQIS